MIIVFAGAGASKAVNTAEYPTTVEFFQRLPDSIKSDLFFSHVCDFLRQKSDAVTIDIEQVLWAVHEWNEFARTLSDECGLPGWLLAENRIVNLGHGSIDFGGPVGIATSVASAALRLESQINTHIYDWYSRLPTSHELENTWLPLFAMLQELDNNIEIVTTNYDLILEAAVTASNLRVELGRTFGIQPILDVKQWDIAEKPLLGREKGLLTKLHGSIDWSIGRDVIHVGTPTYRGRHEDHVIIYPGFKGVPARPPFDYFHQYFEAALTLADVIIFIGFAFRDEYINDLLQSRLAKDTQVVVINPAEVVDLIPLPSSQYHHIRSAFDSSALGQLAAHLTAKESPRPR